MIEGMYAPKVSARESQQEHTDRRVVLELIYD